MHRRPPDMTAFLISSRFKTFNSIVFFSTVFPICLCIKYPLLKLIVFAFSFAAESRGGQLVELQLLENFLNRNWSK
jgi:hypothetical protein